MPVNRTESFLQAAEKYAAEQKSANKGDMKTRPKNKTDKFLKAIKKYAKEQKTAMQGEVKQLKTERLKEAEDKAKRDSEELIRERKAEMLNRQTAMLATKTQEGLKKLFVERSRMVDEVFRLAKEKLIAFTATDAYRDKLRESAAAVAEVFGDSDCVLCVNERDLGAAEELKSIFGGSAEVKADRSITIGGIRGWCGSMRLIADETLDSKLAAQREWFIENANLSVL